MALTTWFYLLLIISLAYTASAPATDEHNQPHCELTTLAMKQELGSLMCTSHPPEMIDGNQRNSRGVQSVPAGRYLCTLMDDISNTSVHVLCSKDGSWQIEDFQSPASSTGNIGQLHRQKRFFFWGLAVGILGTALIACVVFCHGKRHHAPTPDTEDPVIRCPRSPGVVTAGKKQRKTVVNLSRATATDNKGQTSITMKPPKFPPSKLYGRGRYTYVFSAKDRSGNVASCRVSFSVKVVRCNRPKSPGHGKVRCSHNYPVYGDTCVFTCDPGFKVSTSSQVKQECLKNGRWSTGGAIDCQRITCGPPPSPADGVVSKCNMGYLYESTCKFDCKEGFTFPSSGTRFVTCTNTGRWSSNPVDCQDTTPPTIVNCPSDIDVYSDSMLTSTVVTWSPPIASDNADSDIVCQQTEGLSPGSRLEAGITYRVQYDATDSASNDAIPCRFSVRVQVTTCPAVPFATRLIPSCPESVIYGAHCNFTCERGFPLVGLETAFCIRNDSNPAVGFWDWGINDTAPYCEVVLCDELIPPLNGALACDNWLLGVSCQMSCNDKFDIPRGATPSALWVCDQTGKWNPDIDVPDCSETRRPGRINLRNELHYFTGDCSSPDTQEAIKANFVQFLNGSQYKSLCTENEECRTENVKVICGTTTGSKRKRSTLTHTAIVEFDISIRTSFDSNATDLWTYHDDRLFVFADALKEEVSQGKFNITVPGLAIEVDQSSFTSGWSDIQCEEGEEATKRFTCAPCPTGTHYNASSDECDPCHVGYYASNAGAIQCTQCEDGTSTLGIRAKDEADCIALCQTGTVSDTGLVPCGACPPGSYQPAIGQNQCVPCPPGTTSPAGSTESTQCQAYEAYVAAHEEAHLESLKSPGEESFSVTAWFLLSSTLKSSSNEVLVTVYSPELTLVLSYAQRLTASLELENSTTHALMGHDVADNNWHYVAVSWDSSACSLHLYVDGDVTTEVVCGTGPSVITSLQIGSVNNAVDIHVSMMSVWDGVPISTTLVPDSCHGDDTAAIWKWSQLVQKQLPPGLRISYPTTCGDGMDCLSDTCNGHICIDQIHGYLCQCGDKYTGKDCEVPPDFCADVMCENNAVCLNEDDGFVCNCSHGYRGMFCQYRIVNGQWSDWSRWSECSVSCGGGRQHRSRSCSEPAPGPEGLGCIGEDNEEQDCNEEPCPECTSLNDDRRGFGRVIACNETLDQGQTILACTVSCRAGLTNSLGRPFQTECGQHTNYVWSHQLTDATRTLPYCSRTKVPSILEIRSTVKLDIDCSVEPNKTALKAALGSPQTEISENANCLTEGSCHQETIISGCDDVSRRRRAKMSAVTVTNVIIADLSGAPKYFVDNGLDNETAIIALEMWANALMDLENVGRLLQEAVDQGLLKFNIGGEVYTVDPAYFVQSGSVSCGNGETAINALCVNCPPGSQEVANQCEWCEVGSYQDEEGQTSCKQCPVNTTTLREGADGIHLCTETTEYHDEIDLTTGRASNDVTTSPGQRKITTTAQVTLPGRDSVPYEIVIPTTVAGALLIMLMIACCVIYKKMKRSSVKLRLLGDEAQATLFRPTTASHIKINVKNSEGQLDPHPVQCKGQPPRQHAFSTADVVQVD